MNVLVMGRAKTGTTVISKSIEAALGPGTEYYLEPKDITFFDHEQFAPPQQPQPLPSAAQPQLPSSSSSQPQPHRVVKIIFEHWSRRPNLRNAIINNELKLHFQRFVFIFRDPRDELVSRLFYVIRPYKDHRGLDLAKLDRWLSIIRLKEINPGCMSFRQMAEQFDEIMGTKFLDSLNSEILPGLQMLQRFRQQAPKGVFWMKYESFIDGSVKELSTYMGRKIVPVTDVGVLSRTFRTGGYGNWRRVFTPADVEFFQPLFAPFLEENGYTDWTLDPTPRLDPKQGSEYVLRIASE